MESIMMRIDVALGTRAYPILIGSGLLAVASDHLGKFAKSGRLVVVSDDNAWAAQGAALTAGLPVLPQRLRTLNAIEDIPVKV